MIVSFKSKFILLLLLPFLVLGIFFFDKITHFQLRKNDLQVMQSSMRQLEHTSELTYQLQKERDLAVNFTAYPSMSVENKLREQLQITDSVEAYYRAFIIENNLDTSDFSYLNTFQEIRESVINFSFETEQVESYYKDLIRNYLDLAASCGAGINTPMTREEIKAYLALSEAKEGFGEIRNIINRVLNSGSFQGLEYGLFSSEKGRFEYNLNTFIKHSSQNYRMRFQTDIERGAMINTLDIIYNCFETNSNDLEGFTSDYWWISSKGMCDHLYELQLLVVRNIKESLHTQQGNLQVEMYSLYLNFSLFLFGLLVPIAFVFKGFVKHFNRIDSVSN